MSLTFGEFLMTRRKEKGLTQKDLANMLFVSESTVSKWEQNRAKPDITMVSKLSEILGVSEHELITASIDNEQRQINKNARKWKNLTFTWNLFFLISYSITLLVCFICNLAVNHTLSWFWIVLSSLILCASLTNLPRYVRKFKLLILSITPLLSLILLIGVCCISSCGNWFLVAILPIILAFIIIFLPIYLKAYPLPKFIKTHKCVICAFVNFFVLMIMLYVIERYSLNNDYATKSWATKTALPICLYFLTGYLIVIYLTQYAKINRWFKTSLTILTFTIYTLFLEYFLKLLGLDSPSNFNPNFSKWSEPYIDSNVTLIATLSLLFLSIIFALIGLIRRKNKN